MAIKGFAVVASVGLALVPGFASAATHLVPGDFATISAALSAAVAGDEIVLVDNTTPYEGNLYVTTDNITIRGQANLDPKPLIRGVSAPHPLAGQGPQSWFWLTGDPNSAFTGFDASGAAIVNDADGLILQDLRIAADPLQAKSGAETAGVLDFRFGDNGTVINCELSGQGLAALGAERLVVTANTHTFTNVTFTDCVAGLEQMGGTVTMTDSHVIGQAHLMMLNGGTFNCESTVFESAGTVNNSRGIMISNQYGAMEAFFEDCTLRKTTTTGNNAALVQMGQHSRGSSVGTDDFNTGRYSPNPVGATFTQCDFIGGTEVNQAVRLDTGRAGWVVKTLRFTGCNFYNLSRYVFNTKDFHFPGNDYKLGGEVDRFEDYNAFHLSQNNAPVAGISSGGHSIVLTGDPLYVDPANDDFQLAANSPAATLQTAGPVPYTGSYGVSTTNVAVNKLTVGHSGADYTSISAAVAAATNGALIEIIDNSAPYEDNVLIPTSTNAITIQGAPGLDPRPTIKGLATADYTIRLSGNSSRSHNIRNLIIDGSDLNLPNCMALDLRDGGVSRVENCKIIGGAANAWAVFAQEDRILRNCEIIYDGPVGAVQQNFSGCMFLLENCSVDSNSFALHLQGGMFIVSDSYVEAKGGDVISIGNGTTSNYLEITDSVITSDAEGPAGTANNMILVKDTPGRRTVVIDNSDIVGSMTAVGFGSSPTGTGIWVQGDTNPANLVRVTDTIFYNIAFFPIFFGTNTGAASYPGLSYDPKVDGAGDFNVYQLVVPNADDVPEGLNELVLGDTDPLYVDPPNDFRVLSTSAAATHNSTGVPPYAGSQGVFIDSVVNDWSVY